MNRFVALLSICVLTTSVFAAKCDVGAPSSTSPCCNAGKYITTSDFLDFTQAKIGTATCLMRPCPLCAVTDPSDVTTAQQNQAAFNTVARFLDTNACWDEQTARSPGQEWFPFLEPRNVMASYFANSNCNTAVLAGATIVTKNDLQNTCLNVWEAHINDTAWATFLDARLQVADCGNRDRCPLCGVRSSASRDQAALNQAILSKVGVYSNGDTSHSVCWGHDIAREPADDAVALGLRDLYLHDMYCASCDLTPITGPNPPTYDCNGSCPPGPLNLTVPLAAVSGVLAVALAWMCYRQRRAGLGWFSTQYESISNGQTV